MSIRETKASEIGKMFFNGMVSLTIGFFFSLIDNVFLKLLLGWFPMIIGGFYVVYGILLIMNYSTHLKEWEAADAQHARVEAEQRRRQSLKTTYDRYQRALDFYRKCSELGIDHLAGNENKIKMVAETKSSISPQDALALYREGAKPEEKVLAAVHSYLHFAEIDNDRKARPGESANLIGKDKYTHRAQAEIARLSKKRQGCDAMQKGIASGAFVMQPDKPNTTAATLKGQIIGGPAMGAAYAAEARREYEEAQKTARDLQNSLNEFSDVLSSQNHEDILILSEWQRSIYPFEQLLIDVDETEKLFSKINIDVTSPEITEGGNLRICVKTSYKENPTILTKPAIIDGSVRIFAKYNGRVLGNVVYCPRGFNQLNPALIMGFGSRGDNFRIIELEEGEEEPLISKIQFEIKPVHLWALEIGDNHWPERHIAKILQNEA